MMQGRCALLVAASVTLGLAQPALADAEGDTVMAKFARCVALGKPDRVRALLATMPDSQEEFKILDAMAETRAGCLTRAGKLKMPRPLMRGAMAEALYRKEFGNAGAVPAGAPGQPRATGEGDLLAFAVARCVTATAPDKVAALVATPRASPGEKAALAPVLATMQDCVPLDRGVRTGPALLRAKLAEELYEYRWRGKAG